MLLLLFSGSDEFDADPTVGRTFIVPARPVFVVEQDGSRVHVVPEDNRVYVVPEKSDQ